MGRVGGDSGANSTDRSLLGRGHPKQGDADDDGPQNHASRAGDEQLFLLPFALSSGFFRRLPAAWLRKHNQPDVEGRPG